MKPSTISPETKKGELYKSPEIFEKLDKRAMEVSLIWKIQLTSMRIIL